MNPDLLALEQQKKQYQEGLNKLQTLTGRLDEIDAAKQMVMPEALKRVSLEGRAPMEDPSARMSALTSIQGSPFQKNTDAVELQLKTLAELRAAIEANKEGEDKDKLTQKDILDYQLKAKELGMKFNPKTMSFEPLSKEESISSVELKGTSKTDMEMLRAMDAAAKAAEGMHDPKYSGLLDSIMGLGRVKTNAEGSDKEAQFRQTVSELQNTIRNYISGAAVNVEEAKYLRDLYPNLTDSDTEIKRKIKGVQDYAKRKAQGILDTGGYKVDAGEYLGNTGARTQTVNEQADPLGIL